MANVLLLLPLDANARTASREAIAAAKERSGRLIIAVVLQPELVEKVSSALTDNAFMGEKLSDRLAETLLRDHRTRAEALAAEIAAEARVEGVETEQVFEEGDPAEICRRLVPLHSIGLAVLVAERRSWLTRLLSRHPLELPTLAGCEARVFEEDEDE